MSERFMTVLGPIPEEWESKTIGELAIHVGSGITPTGGSDVYTDSGVTFIRSQNVTNDGLLLDDVAFIDKKTHDRMKGSEVVPFDVLLNITGASIGRCCFLPSGLGSTNVNQHVCAIRLPKPIWADAKFLASVLASPIGQNQIYRLNAGGNREGLNYQQLKVFRIPWPPRECRAGIARILTTLDNLIEKTEALIAKYQAIKQGMMHDLFTRGVDAHGHLRPPQVEAPDLYKQSELGWIPKEWKTCRVDDVGSVKLGRQRSPKHQSGRFTTPYLRVANVFDGFIDYSDVLEMDFTPTEKDTYSLLPGDVLLNEGQSLELVGRSAIYEGEPYHFCFQNTLIRFRAYPPNDPRFCRGIFKFYIDIGRFMTIARQTTSVAHLGADRLAKLAFPCPEPDEQSRIANALLQHEKQCALDRAYKDNLVQQKTGLMQDLLTGKVRVKVDIAEEVAHA